MRKGELRLLASVVVFFAVALIFYPLMPDYMASHWNAQGVVDGFIPKVWGLLLFPLLALMITFLFKFLCNADPLKKNIEKFLNYYYGLLNLVLLFLFYIYILTIAWNLGYRFNFIMWIMPAFSVLFYFAGIVIENTKRNYTIGIRTPWTLADDSVWEKTHKLGGLLFKISGLFCFVGMLFDKMQIFFIILPVLFFSIFLVFYSYYVFKRIKQTPGTKIAKSRGKKH